jgi:membrane-associated phospholipid phosphatase
MSVAPRTVDKDEVGDAWRLLTFTWWPLGAMGAALAISLALSRFSIDLPGFVLLSALVAIYGSFAYANASSPRRRDPQVMFALGATAQLVLITMLMAPLTYVAAAAGFPLQDANLLTIDRALGFDWAAYVYFVDEHPQLAGWLSYGYGMIRWPIFAIPVILAAAHRYGRIAEFTLAFALALTATTIISGLVPAIGVYQEIGLDPGLLHQIDPRAYLLQVRDLGPVRDGVLRHLDLINLAGIVTFPSFHAASAALYAWAFWPVRWMRPIAVLANAAMLASTPIDGGHYLIDLIAGIAIALLAIFAARAIAKINAGKRTANAVQGAAIPAE